MLDDHYTAARDQRRRRRAAAASTRRSRARARATSTALRELFQRKALLARQGRVCALLLRGRGADHDARSCALRVADLPDHPEVARCLALRRELGLPCGPDAPALVAGDGSRDPPPELRLWLRRARLVGLSLESNGGLCRSLLRVRHGVPDPTEEVAT